jgi:hypothetical protein
MSTARRNVYPNTHPPTSVSTNHTFSAVPQIKPEQQQQPQPASYDPKPSAMTGPPIPRAINRLQVSESQINERKFTPMDVDVSSRPASSKGGEEEVLNSRGKIVIGGGEGYGFCRPGEDCEDCG